MAGENKNITMLYAYGLNILAKGADIGFFLLVVKLLSKEDMGLLNTITSLSAFFYLLINGGLIESAMREMAQNTHSLKEIISKSLAARLMLAILVILLIFTYHAYYQEDERIFSCLIYALLFQILSLIQNLYFGWLKANDKQSRANSIVFLEALLKLAIIFVVQLQSLVDIIVIWKITVSIKLCLVIASALMFSKKLKSIPIKRPAYIIHPGQIYFLFISLLTLAQNRLDWMLVGLYLDQSAVASYSVANKFYEIIIFVLGIGATTLYPWICKMQAGKQTYAEKNKINLLNRIQRYIGVTAIPVAVIFYPLVNRLIWEGRYPEIEHVLKSLLPCLLLAVTNMKLYYEILAQRKEKRIVYLSLIATGLQALFNVFAIRRWGIEGAIMGMWLLNGINVILYYLLKTEFSIKWRDLIVGDIGSSFIMAFSLLAACFFLSPLYLAIAWLGAMCIIVIWERRQLSIGR